MEILDPLIPVVYHQRSVVVLVDLFSYVFCMCVHIYLYMYIYIEFWECSISLVVLSISFHIRPWSFACGRFGAFETQLYHQLINIMGRVFRWHGLGGYQATSHQATLNIHMFVPWQTVASSLPEQAP